MKCPACREDLRQKTASGMTIDICYGGCGGIWFDARELEGVDARAAATLHTVWHDSTKRVVLTEPRQCPRCPNQVLNRRWFSDAQNVEIDQCPSCHGIWLDEGEFSRVYEEIKGAKVAPPGWSAAIAKAAAGVASSEAGDSEGDDHRKE